MENSMGPQLKGVKLLAKVQMGPWLHVAHDNSSSFSSASEIKFMPFLTEPYCNGPIS